ncbi:MAG: phosphate/phosphite/phosphonate ABC transporter substrate-binding protein [Gammaproteobacteria bacterium]
MRCFVALLALAFAAGCDPAPSTPVGPVYQDSGADTRPLYRFAVHPLHNPRKLVEAYQPLIVLLNERIDTVRFKVEASRDYQAYEAKFRDREPAFILPNPWQTLEAMKVGYSVIAMAGDARDFKGIFIVRKDSGIREPADLVGKTVSYPSHTALAAAIMPQRFLHDHGVDTRAAIENRYVGSQESSIMNVLLGDSMAGATWPPPWRLFQRDRPDDAAKLKVIWETPPLVNNSVMARDDIPEALVQKVSAVLHGLHETEQGRAVLAAMGTARFHPATDADYTPVRDFIDRFERDIRPVEQP